MKRLVLLILLVATVAWFTSARQADMRHRRARAAAQRAARVHAQPPRPAVPHDRDENDDDTDDVDDSIVEVREAVADAAQDVREALQEAAQEIREAVDGIPVPIVPGTRVTEAVAEAPEPPRAPRPPVPPRATRPPMPPAMVHPFGHKSVRRSRPVPPAPPVPSHAVKIREVDGLISATKERAEREARAKLDQELGEWLEPLGVPRSWKPSPRQVEAMILGTSFDVEEKPAPLGVMYTAELKVDASPERLAEIAQTYRRQVIGRRMAMLGGVLAFILICLGAVSSYIRADEATKGYYTNRLRMLAAAGVGAAGAVIYQILA